MDSLREHLSDLYLQGRCHGIDHREDGCPNAELTANESREYAQLQDAGRASLYCMRLLLDDKRAEKNELYQRTEKLIQACILNPGRRNGHRDVGSSHH
ncbi:hypothetical protein [Caulobacter sp. S45]|uniref:hypothetical protein n=1 Tax=Caulobacter sp. S45 TaxID=1641861 RepID=UPI00131CB6C2|nr:hypothetical protein [Caulobacter sp. S45]